ncbi:MAG TPA: GMC oxidoreductase [Gemmatimonadaceae bacterium]|nr:GMC oxidoreductase [Gemmatimonadaceae bacterium]
MARHLVIGSGASGVHYALTVLQRGEEVTLLDVGFERPVAPLPDATYPQLKEQLDDPLTHFLGPRAEYVVYPAPGSKPYGFPPNKEYVFRRAAPWSLRQQGFDPLVSFARGGLAEAWTGGSYELDDRDLAAFPFTLGDLQPHYATVAKRVGITGERDDLERFSPMSAPYDTPLPLDPHSAHLLALYHKRRRRVNALGVYFGRSRVAVLTRPQGERQSCTALGRCLMGCPRESLYAPSYTLRELHEFPGFTYVPSVFVDRVLVDGNGAAIGAFGRHVRTGEELRFSGDRVVLAAGALATTRIYLATMLHEQGTAPELSGLMDNRHVSMPFVTPVFVGRDVALASYQFHHVALGMRGASPAGDVHGQLTALKAAQIHPIVSSLPFDFHTSLQVFRRVRAALGVANFWLADTRRTRNVARLVSEHGVPPHLQLHYADDDVDLEHTRAAITTIRRALRALDAFAPKSQTTILPRGSSVHYGGTLPMTREEAPHTCRPDGSVRGFERLLVADGAAFAALPAKNLTFTLMANAVRIASAVT